MTPQYPVEPVIPEPESPKLKDVSFFYGRRNMSHENRVWDIAHHHFKREKDVGKLVELAEMVAKIKGCTITLSIVSKNGFVSIHVAEPTDYTGMIHAEITMYHDSNGTGKPRSLYVVTEDAIRLEEIILDRQFNYGRVNVTYALPSHDGGYFEFHFNESPFVVGGPVAARRNLSGEITANFKECYASITTAIERTTGNNYNVLTQTYSYLLIGTRILPENIARLERLLRQSGWTTIRFIEQPQCILMELK